jgi:hypothetical protein
MNNQGYNPNYDQNYNPYQGNPYQGNGYQEEPYQEGGYSEEIYEEEPIYEEPVNNNYTQQSNMYPNEIKGESYNPNYSQNYDFNKGFEDIMGGVSFDDVDADDDSINFSLDSSNFKQEKVVSDTEDEDEDLEIF